MSHWRRNYTQKDDFEDLMYNLEAGRGHSDTENGSSLFCVDRVNMAYK